MHKNEKGFASIVIALVLIIVLALFTIGFAQLARREQQTALDKQKAIQARYAAESGINNAYQDILSGKINDTNASDTDCMKAGGGPNNLPAGALTANQDINVANGVSYSCVLVMLHTNDLQVDNLSPGSGRHVVFGTDDPLEALNIKWGSATGRTSYAANLNADKPQLTSTDNWAYPPLLEFSITPVDSLPGANTAQYLEDNSFTFYAYPSAGGSNSISYNPSKQGQVVPGACSGTGAYACSLKLSNLGGRHKYLLRIVGFYDTANISITGSKAGGGSTKFTGEPMIDVTGKARDVLKRLRVRLFLNTGPDNNTNLPNNAIEAQNVCKRIQTAPPTPDFPQGTTYDGLDASCNLSN